MHLVSFRGTDQVDDEQVKKCADADGSQKLSSKFDRRRSRSLPKSLLSVRNGLRRSVSSRSLI